MTKTAETLARAPLAKLSLAPENARFGSKDLGDIAAMAASIVAVGDLIDPLKVYAEGDGFKVWDGGRRLAALNHIDQDKKLKMPAALAGGVPYVVTAKETAALLSRATFVREGLDAAEEFANYKALLDAGLQPEAIAAACAVATPRVKQLLRLADVAPEILKAFVDHKIALDVVEAFTLSADKAKQLEVWKSFKGGTVAARQVKEALRKGAIGADDRIARFVGRDVYEAAGGVFLQDLFTGRDDEAWADGELARKLAQSKIGELIAKHQAEGWAWVKFAPYEDYYYDRGLKQLPKPAGGEWSDEAKATSGVFLKMGHNGEVDVQRGWASPAKVNKAAGTAPAKPDQGLYGFGHGNHFDLTLIAGEAVRVALAKDPAAAYDALLTHLAWVVLRRREGTDFYSGVGTKTASLLVGEERKLELQVDGSKEFGAAKASWQDRLPTERVEFCDAVAALSPDEKAELLALCFADTVAAVEGRFDERKPTRWAHLTWMARRAGVDVAKVWTPPESFIKGGSREALLIAAKEIGGQAFRDDAKKKDLVAYVAANAAKVRWLPKLLRDLVAAPDAPKAPKAARKAGKPSQDPEAPPAAPEAADEPSAAVLAMATGKAKPIKGADDAED